MDGRMEQMGTRLVESGAHFSKANQRLANEAELAGVVESERYVRM